MVFIDLYGLGDLGGLGSQSDLVVLSGDLNGLVELGGLGGLGDQGGFG